MPNKRIRGLTLEQAKAAIADASSLRHALRNLSLHQNSVNTAELRSRLLELGLPVPTVTASSARWQDRQALQNAVDQSTCYSEVLRALHLDPQQGSNLRTLKSHLARLGICSEGLKGGQEKAVQALRAHRGATQAPLSDLLVENSRADRSTIKRRLIAEGLLRYQCAGCNNRGEWRGRPLTLELEHKNGVNNDNRLSNLEFLCPNCHAQTETFAGRNGRRPARERRRAPPPSRSFKIEWPAPDDLQRMVLEMPLTRVAKQLGVSDNGVRKRLQALGLALPVRKTAALHKTMAA